MKKKNNTDYQKVIEPERYYKEQNWKIAIGLQEVDGLKPTEYLKSLAQENIDGKKTIYEVQEELKKVELNEADIVSAKIVEFLDDPSFIFDPIFLEKIHEFLFKDIYDFAGKIRDYNITKKEEILNGDTVRYAPFSTIKEALKYDFEEEKKANYISLTNEQKVNQIANFVSDIWQVHPFGEGNTRTIAVFIEKYLISMGFDVNNEPFEKYSLYFRNALVRANYTLIPKNITPTYIYLNKFFRNILIGKEKLDVKELYITRKL